MDDILTTYELETIEQIRAVADELRMRIINQLVLQAMTVTQLAEVFGEAPNKLHYHVRELERVGLLKKVETREKGGILEKYYRAVAREIRLPQTLLSNMAPDEAVAMLLETMQPYLQGITRAAGKAMRLSQEDEPDSVIQFSPHHYWMTAEELIQVSQQINTLFQPYKNPRGIAQEREQTVLLAAYTTALADEEKVEAEVEQASAKSLPASTNKATSVRSKKPELIVVAGIIDFSRQDLEEFLAQGKTHNVYVLGSCTFADDIPPDLVERSIASFHLKGKVNASPAVLEVLKRKGGGTDKKKYPTK